MSKTYLEINGGMRAGVYDFDKSDNPALFTSAKTFSVGIFMWDKTSNGKYLKRTKAAVRVIGDATNAKAVYEECNRIRKALDLEQWNGKKSVKVKS